MSSWLANRLGVHWNLRPYAAAAGGILGGMVGGPLGAGLGAGLFKTGDDLAHGDSFGHALGQGALNGALAYGTAGLFHGGAGGAAGSAAGDVEQAGSSAIPNSALGITGDNVQANVMRRVLGNAGSFVKNNREPLETVGQGAQGILAAANQNKQSSIEQQRANAEAAQIQAAIDKQKSVTAAFQQMYGRGLPTQGTPTLQPSSSLNGPSRSMMAPGGRVNGQGGVGPVTGDPGNGNDPNDPNDPNGGPKITPIDQGPVGNGPPGTPTKLSILARLGYMPAPSSSYAGNDSMYGSPYGYGYSSMNSYGGGY